MDGISRHLVLFVSTKGNLTNSYGACIFAELPSNAFYHDYLTIRIIVVECTRIRYYSFWHNPFWKSRVSLFMFICFEVNICNYKFGTSGDHSSFVLPHLVIDQIFLDMYSLNDFLNLFDVIRLSPSISAWLLFVNMNQKEKDELFMRTPLPYVEITKGNKKRKELGGESEM